MTTTTIDTPRIYVASLSDYNAGILHGTWIDADQDADAIQLDIDTMLQRSPSGDAEEWSIHDTDGFPNLGENPSLETVAAIGCAIAEHGDAFIAWCGNSSYNTENPELFAEHYQGEYESLEDYAREYVEESGMLQDVPENVKCYFDYEMFARDLGFDFDVLDAPGGNVYIFTNH